MSGEELAIKWKQLKIERNLEENKTVSLFQRKYWMSMTEATFGRIVIVFLFLVASSLMRIPFPKNYVPVFWWQGLMKPRYSNKHSNKDEMLITLRSHRMRIREVYISQTWQMLNCSHQYFESVTANIRCLLFFFNLNWSFFWQTWYVLP